MSKFFKFTENGYVPVMESELINGDRYKTILSLGAVIEGYWNTPSEISAITILVKSVTGDVQHSSDFTHITCNELTNITITGTVAVPDRTFSMPIRRDDGRLILFPVTVVNGAFEAVLNFPTSGQYSYSDVEANIDLPANTFSVAPIKLDVLRQAT